jgi:hypothetical protein
VRPQYLQQVALVAPVVVVQRQAPEALEPLLQFKVSTAVQVLQAVTEPVVAALAEPVLMEKLQRVV